ncbi:D-alanyl-D-alanine carboxypeptidase/D-alanyl-D-alanine endopeptidase [Guptibacillus hwajinpoensis]|uniref:D-alanyl-D-alanine carboxypeptidase/D-alanyl-D-alanine endopeptidase n=1 Tax=Guptibacillus hwajinpoensis TaxID=208199 RepID=UPI001CFE2D49|nr:D-alanyl-D-alanine carboxypeptidase/D-alanyl-D-alanine-endopeptidase [Pseudalkalibacillus hwajinpoensis]WLR60007.1 D-alanyl-D-alanine carboxypeptidase/D-alanyl-D-alanine-endopeptidase [Pseudalkalibacillus hwajinpoensis]
MRNVYRFGSILIGKVVKKIGIKKKLACGVVISSLFLGSRYRKKRNGKINNGKTLSHSLHSIVNDERLHGAIAGISIRCNHSGELLYDHFGDLRMTPASNMKLITAAAALEKLGADYRFSTEVETDGEIQDGRLMGNLYLKGKGDPTVLKEDLDQFALELKALGIERIQGDVIGDYSWYDEQHLSEDMVWSDEHEYYGAQISALTISPDRDFDAGTIIVEVSPGEEGDSPKVVISPTANEIQLVNNALTTSPSYGEGELHIFRQHGTNTLTISGTISKDASPEKKWIALWNPNSYALRLFKDSLKRLGIYISEEALKNKSTEIKTLFTKQSMPLSELLLPFMKLSNNGHAEVLIKEMGRKVRGEGSFSAGLEVVRTFLREEGLDPDNMCLRDGSGISQMNLIQPNQLSLLLFKLQSKPWFSLFLNSLPVAGIPDRLVGGTLRERLSTTSAEGVVFAKTGSLIGVTSLSGYVKTSNPLIFSIIINKFLDEEEMEKIEDELMIVLASTFM